MALLSTLTAGNLTNIRSDANWRAIQFLCIVPLDVVAQGQPLSAPTNAVYASISMDTAISGDYADVEVGQTVIYSTTSDYQQTEIFRTRIRKTDASSTLYVAENSQGLTTAYYITVLNTYEVHEKLQKSASLRDWDVTYRKLLPVETALPSAVVLSNGATAYAPTAVPKEMDADATTTFTHAWASSNSNDTLDSGGTTASPSFTLEAGAFRWIRYTFTDSNGNSNFRVIPIWTVPKDYSSQVVTGFGADSGEFAAISFDPELGWTCTVPAFSGIVDTLNRSYCVVARDEWLNNSRQTIRTNIDFVGFLQNESTTTGGNEEFGRLSETRFTIEGFGHALARQNISSIRVIRDSTPTAWGEIKNPTPARMLTYHWTEGSTILNLCSLSIPSDDTSFVGDDLSITQGKALDDARFIAEVVNAEVQFDCDGRLDLARNLIYLDDTARDAADIVVSFLTTDVLEYAIDFAYGSTTSTLEMSGGAFDSTNGVYDLYKSISPAVARLSEGDALKITNQVLTTDASASAAKTELGERAANYFAANQPNYTLNARLKDAWHFLVPDNAVWFKFPLAESDTARGKVFSASDRWQLVSIDTVHNNLTGARDVSAVFRLETQSTGAMVVTSAIENDSFADILFKPMVLAPFTGADLSLTNNGGWWDSQDPTPPSEPTPPDEECEIGGFRPKYTSSYETSTPAANGENITITVAGAGQVGAGEFYDFTAGQNGFVPAPQAASASDAGVYTISVGFEDNDTVDTSGNSRRAAGCEATGLSLGTVTKVIVTYDYTKGSPEGDLALESHIRLNGSDVATSGISGFSNGTDLTWQWTGEVSSVTSVRAKICCDYDIGDNRPGGMTGSVTIKSIQINDATIYGDAFYTWTGGLFGSTDVAAYGASDGLLVEGSQPSSIPPFSPEHQYTIYDTVTSGPILYEFGEPFGTSQMGNWSLQITTCFNGVP